VRKQEPTATQGGREQHRAASPEFRIVAARAATNPSLLLRLVADAEQ
jgi:hypothetical protein